MIRINLLPVKEIKAEVSRRREVMIGVLSLGACVLLVLCVYVYQLRQTSELEQQLSDLRTELQMFNVKAKNVAELQAKIKAFENKHKVLENINKKKSGPARVLESLSTAAPNTLWLTEFKELGGDATITGLATDNQIIADFLRALEGNAFFKDTELVETAQSEQTGVAPRRFSIKSKILYQPIAQPSGGKTENGVPSGRGNQP